MLAGINSRINEAACEYWEFSGGGSNSERYVLYSLLSEKRMDRAFCPDVFEEDRYRVWY